MLFLWNIASVAQRTFEIVDKNVRTWTTGPQSPTCEVPSDVSRKLQLTLCTIMAL